MIGIKLVIFDMDGTVFESHLDWLEIKKKLNLKNENILKEIYKDHKIDYKRLRILESFERLNTLKTKPIKGILEFLKFLKTNGIKTALITNNNKNNTDYLLNKYRIKFDTVITREMNLWKPDPDAFFYLMEAYNIFSNQIISIGDSSYDVRASKSANIQQIYIIQKNGKEIPKEDEVIYFKDFNHLKKICLSRYPQRH